MDPRHTKTKIRLKIKIYLLKIRRTWGVCWNGVANVSHIKKMTKSLVLSSEQLGHNLYTGTTAETFLLLLALSCVCYYTDTQ